MSKGSRSKRPTEAERLAAEVPEYLRIQGTQLPPTSSETPALSESEESATAPMPDFETDYTEDQEPGPSNPTPAPDPSGTHVGPSISRGWVSSVHDPPTSSPKKPEGKAEKEIEELEYMKMIMVAGFSAANADKIPVRAPDRFDGTKPEKFDAFEGQCRMVFLGDEKKFNTPRKQALYAGSYLDGAPYEWWLQVLRTSDTEFKAISENFWKLLRERFGNPDHHRTIERQLSQLQMKDTDHVNRHIVRFDTLAIQLDWNEAALRSRFENSLNTRLKDDLGRMEPAVMRNLTTMKERVTALDRRYWERQEEIKREKGKSGNSDGGQGSKKPSNNSSSPNTSSSSSSSSRPPNKSGPAPAQSSSSSSRPTTDSSGRITAEERKRRMDSKLCLYCGKEGHGVKTCPVSEAKAKKKAAGNSSKN
jgi:hypothetical protein